MREDLGIREGIRWRTVEVLALAVAVLVVSFAAGCTYRRTHGVRHVDMDATDPFRGTQMDAADLRAVADHMIRSLRNDRDVSDRVQKDENAVLLQSVQFHSSQSLDPEILTLKIQTEFDRASEGWLTFLDRSAIAAERELKRKGEVDTSGLKAVRGADMILTGTVREINSGPTRYVLYTFRMKDAETGEILWQDSKEVMKQQW